MYINNLKKVMSPPIQNYNNGSKNLWENVELDLGCKLPKDYKEFINEYGTGGIDNFIWILTPFEKDMSINLKLRSEEILHAYKISKKNNPNYFKHDIFPQIGGLFPWAYTENGDEIFWLTSPNSDEWRIVVYESRSSDYYEYNMGMAEFLYKIIIKEINCPAFPIDFPSESIEFITVEL